MKNYFYVIIFFILFSSNLYSQIEKNEYIKRTIIITPIYYESRQKEYEYLKQIIRDVLKTKLDSTKIFNLMNTKEIDKKIRQLNYKKIDLMNKTKLSDFCINSGADIIVFTKYSVSAKNIKIEIRIFNLLTKNYSKTYFIREKVGIGIIENIDNTTNKMISYMQYNYKKIEAEELKDKINKKYGKEKQELYSKKKGIFKKEEETVKIKKDYYEVKINNKPEVEFEVVAVKDEDILFFESDENIFLKPGEWTLVIKSEYFKKHSLKIKITDKDEIIDFFPKTYRGSIIFQDLKKESKVFLDDEDVTNIIEYSKLEVNTGLHKLKITTENYHNFVKEITIKRNEEIQVNIIYTEIKKINFTKRTGAVLLGIGGGFLLAGIITTSVGAVLNFSPMSMFGGFGGSTGTDNSTIGVFAAGIVLISTGLIFGIISIPLLVKGNKMKVSFNMRYNKNTDLYFSYKF